VNLTRRVGHRTPPFVAAVVMLCACRAIPLAQDPTGAPVDSMVSPPAIFEVDWWTPLVTPKLLEYQPAETAQPAVDGDTERIFVSTRDGTFRCIEPDKGLIAWEKQFGGRSFAGATVESGIVYVPAGDGTLHALRSVNGEELWAFKSNEELVTAPVVVGGKVLVSSQSDTLYAVNEQTGQWVWQYRRDTPSGFSIRGTSTPVVSLEEKLVFQGFADGYMVALGLEDGVVRWEKKLSVSGGTQFLDIDSTPILDDAGHLFAASFKDGLYALNAKTGDIVWKKEKPGINALMRKDTMLVASGDGRLSAFDTERGTLLWSSDLSDKNNKGIGANAGRSPIIARNLAIVPTSTALAFVDLRTGRVRSMWNPSKGMTATPTRSKTVKYGDRIYVVSNGGAIYALRLL
jgi:outer membrane protein assembly factor BamB